MTGVLCFFLMYIYIIYIIIIIIRGLTTKKHIRKTIRNISGHIRHFDYSLGFNIRKQYTENIIGKLAICQR